MHTHCEHPLSLSFLPLPPMLPLPGVPVLPPAGGGGSGGIHQRQVSVRETTRADRHAHQNKLVKGWVCNKYTCVLVPLICCADHTLPHIPICSLPCSELVIVLKPRNLQKVLPSLRIPSGVATPPLHSFSAPKLNDPGHMLRESLTSLKGSLISGKGQLHFDVSQKV